MPPSEADFNDIDLSEDGRTLLIANVNQSNAATFGDGDLILLNLQGGFATILQAPNESSDMKFAAWVQAPIATVNGPLTVVSSTQPLHGHIGLRSGGFHRRRGPAQWFVLLPARSGLLRPRRILLRGQRR